MAQHKSDRTIEDILNTLPDLDEMIRSYVIEGNKSAAQKYLQGDTESYFDQRYGAEIKHLSREEKALHKEYEGHLKKKEDADKRLHDLEPFILDRNTTGLNIPLRDKIRIGLCYTASFVILLMGCVTVYAVIMASGTGVFLDKPYLAVVMSLFVPIGSFVFKFFKDYLPYKSAKTIYSYTIHSAAAFGMIAWIILFGMTFGSAADGFDWESLGESHTGKGSILTIIQCLSEVVIGAALLMIADDIVSKYRPEAIVKNPNIEPLKATQSAHIQDLSSVTSRLKTVQAELAMLQSARMLYKNRALSRFTQKHAQIFAV